MMQEIWRAIPSLSDYIASSHGRIMRLPFIGSMPHGGLKYYGGEPITGIAHIHNGNRPTIYYKGKNYRVSRLVCEAFHGPAPFDRAIVMHIDDDQKNNKPENLKWATQKENLNTEKFIAYCKSRVGENSPTYKGKMRRAS